MTKHRIVLALIAAGAIAQPLTRVFAAPPAKKLVITGAVLRSTPPRRPPLQGESMQGCWVAKVWTFRLLPAQGKLRSLNDQASTPAYPRR